jgi:glycosyltransferase involved in cell wall biosynthesis
MRILVLCSDTGVRIGDGKGASLHLRAIAHAFAALGHRVEVVGIAPSNPEQARGWAMPVHLVPHPGRSQGLERERRKLAATDAVARLAREVATRLRPELIYERLSLFGTAGQQVVAQTGARHVLEVNALLTAEESAWRGLHLASLAGQREAAVLGAADLRVAVSDEVRRAITPYAAGGPSITVPNGVDTDLFAARPDRQQARAAFGLPTGGTLLGFTGSIRPWHGLDTAITALAELPEHIELVVAGDGPVRVQLEQQALSLGVGPRVRWLGALAHEWVPQMLAACDLALAPYPELPNFGFSPLKLYEYLAAGVPVVASDIGQIRLALSGGRWGRLVPPGDASALAAAVTAELADLPAAKVRAAAAREYAMSRHGWTERATRILRAAAPEDVTPNRGINALAG